jgi:hypothetical protein
MDKFGQNRVSVLTHVNFDFNLSYKPLPSDKPMDQQLVLFYKNPFDPLISIWADISVTSLFPTFSAINVLTDPEVANSIHNIISNPEHEAYPFLKKTFDDRPFILFYQNGKIVHIYEGPLTSDDLISYSLSLMSLSG